MYVLFTIVYIHLTEIYVIMNYIYIYMCVCVCVYIYIYNNNCLSELYILNKLQIYFMQCFCQELL